jgi:hypothetical protein
VLLSNHHVMISEGARHLFREEAGEQLVDDTSQVVAQGVTTIAEMRGLSVAGGDVGMVSTSRP